MKTSHCPRLPVDLTHQSLSSVAAEAGAGERPAELPPAVAAAPWLWQLAGGSPSDWLAAGEGVSPASSHNLCETKVSCNIN